MILGDLIQKLRAERGLTIEQVARRCGHSPGTIRWLEAGKSEPRLSSLNALAQAACMLFR
jgi:transcriptional regulator with XRE-family HTH domain